MGEPTTTLTNVIITSTSPISLVYGTDSSGTGYIYNVSGTTLEVSNSNLTFQWTSIATENIVYTLYEAGVSSATLYYGNNASSYVQYTGALTTSSTGGSVPLSFGPSVIINWAFYNDYLNTISQTGGQFKIQTYQKSVNISVLKIGGNTFEYSVTSASDSDPFFYLVVGNIASGETFTIQQTGTTPSNAYIYVFDTTKCGGFFTPCNKIGVQQNATTTTTCIKYTGSGWKTC
uniref:Uncharacterized protein n=1 Tax=viral metagenome TaxID=1070528 RepID=A0A6C0ICX1_9ZZZZ